jgi:predicted dehydrogenase
LIGCGAIAEAFYLPALQKRPDLLPQLVLVDRDAGRANAARAQIGAAEATTDHRTVLDRVDGVIVATPHHLHTPLTLEFVRNGVHVLSEKPISETPEEIDQISSAAQEAGVQVAVNHTRRLFTSFQEVQRIASSGDIGDVKHIDYVLGEPFGWNAQTNTFFGAAAGGRGVLFDTGAHIVDLVCWFLGGEPEVVSYADDSRGGTEAVAELSLRSGDATADLHLSWLSKLRNTYLIEGTMGALEGRVYEWSSFTRRDAAGRARHVKTDKAREFAHFADTLLSNFTEVIEGRANPLVTPADVRPATRIINECYGRRSLIEAPWYDACQELINHA